MNAHTFDFIDQIFYENVWDLLVKEVGASKDPIDKKMFVLDFCQVDSPAIEFRFGGIFGMGGKFWRNSNRFEISCYHETETPERLEVIARVNAEINSLVEKHHPRTQYDLMKLGWRF